MTVNKRALKKNREPPLFKFKGVIGVIIFLKYLTVQENSVAVQLYWFKVWYAYLNEINLEALSYV